MVLPDRWFRAEPDSSGLEVPRLLARRYVHPDALDATITFYERALGVACDARTPIPEAGLELATIGNVLLIGTPGQPSDIGLATTYTVLVPSVTAYLTALEAAGAEVTEPATTAPGGHRARVRHPDGALVEVLDYRPLPEELDGDATP